MESNSKIYVAGHRGLVGSAIYKRLQEKGYSNIVFRTHKELDLTNSQAVAEFFETERPEYVFLAAAKVGGIMANTTYRAQFIFENLQIQNNIIHQAYVNGAKKLLFLGSSCVYPKSAIQPIKEEYLLTDVLEYTNEPYAIAKIAGMKMCESYNLQYGTNFISVMPTNLFGPNDNFHLENSHVLPALLRKFHLCKLLENNDFKGIFEDLGYAADDDLFSENKQNALIYLDKHGIRIDKDDKVSISIWGSGTPLREFLWSEDMADACIFIMETLDFKDLVNNEGRAEVRNTHINIGWGKEISIKDLALLIKDIVGFEGDIHFDITKPDGTLRKLLDVSRLENLGWTPSVELSDGIKRMYQIYKG